MEGETFFMRILPKISLCYIYLFFSYTEVDPAVIAGDGVEMFKNEARMKIGVCAESNDLKPGL